MLNANWSASIKSARYASRYASMNPYDEIKICPQDGTPFAKERPTCPMCGLSVPSRINLSWVPWIIIPLLTILITITLVLVNRTMTHGNSPTLPNSPFWFMGTGAVLIWGYLCLLRCIIRPWQLARRWRHSVAKVVRVLRFPPNGRGGGGTVSILEFQTPSTPGLEKIRV